MKTLQRLALVLLCAMPVGPARADYSKHPEAAAVIEVLHRDHGFSRNEARRALSLAGSEQRILDSMANAAEKTKTWVEYRDALVSDFRIRRGRLFLREQAALLTAAERRFGVPATVVAAILGIETNYGGYTGEANVLDALATLAFDHPRRGAFFRSELVEYLVLCRENGWAYDAALGSYAGAMGWSQFMPSNYRRLAVDGDADGAIDLHTAADAIASTANYLRHHGWEQGAPIAARALVTGEIDESLIDGRMRPRHRVAGLREAGVVIKREVEPSRNAALVRFRDRDSDELWLGFQNFYVISRYNPRAKYALAVYHLARAISEPEGRESLASTGSDDPAS